MSIARRAASLVVAAALAGPALASDDVPGGIGLLASVPGGEPSRMGEAVGRWSRQLCRARFPREADRCVAVAPGGLLVEGHVMGGPAALVMDLWVDERALARAEGIPYAGGGAEFRVPLCGPSPLLEDGERLAATVATERPGDGCVDPPAGDGRDADAGTLAKLRFLRKVVLAQEKEDADAGDGATDPPADDDQLLAMRPEDLPPPPVKARAAGRPGRTAPAATARARAATPPDEARFVPEDDGRE